MAEFRNGKFNALKRHLSSLGGIELNLGKKWQLVFRGAKFLGKTDTWDFFSFLAQISAESRNSFLPLVLG